MTATVKPEVVFELVVERLPNDLLEHVVVVGSLAAAYHFRERVGSREVRTKDADIVVQPAGALATCRMIAERLLDAGWKRTADCHPSAASSPSETLRAIRLHPPDSEAYFVELLAFPETAQVALKEWIPLELADGWYGLPSFRYLGLIQSGQLESDAGLRYADPAMMALANLLSHRLVGTTYISQPIEGRKLLRSAKDLGRVLAIAWLAGRDATEDWVDAWATALADRFPNEWRVLATRAGDGLRELLDDENALDQAHHTTSVGLLSGLGVTKAQLAIVGRRLVVDVVDPLRERATRT